MKKFIFITKVLLTVCLLFSISGCNYSSVDVENASTSYNDISENKSEVNNNSSQEYKNDNIEVQESSGDIFDEIKETKKLDRIYLDNMNIDELFKEFLYGRITIENPFNENDALSAFGWEDEYKEWKYNKDEDYKCVRKFALLDLDNDDNNELIFSVGEDDTLDEIILLIDSDGKQLYCWDIYETHTQHMGSTIYANGVVKYGQNHTGAEEVYYRYDISGSSIELIHFKKYGEETIDLLYNGYYLNGNENRIYLLNSEAEYEELIYQYAGELKSVRWFNCDDIEI